MNYNPYIWPATQCLGVVPDFFNVLSIDMIPSTNEWMMENHAFLPEGAVLFARGQSAGKGRCNRSFYSPIDTGLYFSFLLNPNVPNKHRLLFTQGAALAICLSLEELCGLKPEIKWPNDIMLNGKKIGGILAEEIEEDGCVDTMVIGIGLNLTTRFEGPLKEIAGSAFEDVECPPDAEKTATTILHKLHDIYSNWQQLDILDACRKRLYHYGETVRIQEDEESWTASILDIHETGGLTVERDGQTVILTNPDTSLLHESSLAS